MKEGSGIFGDKRLVEVNEELDTTEQHETKLIKKSGTKRWFAIIFPLLNIAVAALVVYLSMTSEYMDFNDIFAVSVNWWWLVVTFAVIALYVLGEIWRHQILLHAATKRKSFLLGARLYMYERYYSLITPMWLGGRPYQFYYLHKKGFDTPQATSVTVSIYLIGRVGFQLVTGLIIIFFMHRYSELGGGEIIDGAVWFGIAFNLVLSAGLVFLCFNMFLPRKIVDLVIGLLSRMKIVKKPDLIKRKAYDGIYRYRITMRRLMRRPWTLLLTLGLYSFRYFGHLFLVVFLYAALWGWDWSVIPLILLGITLVEYIASMMPVPGGTGAMEIAFIAMLGSIFATPQVLVALVLWKILSYVVPILAGLGFVLQENISDARMRKKENYSFDESADIDYN